jgi:hypothetical protein
VVHVTPVVSAAVTEQIRPSITIEYLLVSVTKLVPEKVTNVPPVTVPNLGLIASSLVVKVSLYVTLFVRVYRVTLLISTATSQL